MTAPSLTVGITYHNEGHLLTDCLTSLLESTANVTEVIVFDDASHIPPDHFVPPGAPVTILRSVTVLGPSRARNQILEASTSTFVHFHDSDDLFDPNWASAVRAAIAPDVDVVVTDVRSCGLDTFEHAAQLIGLKSTHTWTDLLRIAILGSVVPAASTFRRDLAQSIGAFDETLWQSEDYEFHVRLLSTTKRCQIIAQPLATVRLRPEGRSRLAPKEVYVDHVRAIEKLINAVPPSHRHLLAVAAGNTAWRSAELGDFVTAEHATRVARQIDSRTPLGRSRQQQFAARILPLRAAIRASLFYRRLVPRWLRSVITAALGNQLRDDPSPAIRNRPGNAGR